MGEGRIHRDAGEGFGRNGWARDGGRDPYASYRDDAGGASRSAGHGQGSAVGRYGAARYAGSDAQGFGRFTGDDFGGRDFAGWQADAGPYGPGERRSGYGRGSLAGGQGAVGYAGRAVGNRHDERGFFEKAGDEVASWFGDEEAAQRREQDHRGRGPANYTRSDERILEDACDRLTEDWGVDASSIQVTVQSGEVTLDGTVPNRLQKRRAEDCVGDLSGVTHVQNNLRVSQVTDQSRRGSATDLRPRAET